MNIQRQLKKIYNRRRSPGRERHRAVLAVQWLSLGVILGGIVVALLAGSTSAAIDAPLDTGQWVERGRLSDNVVIYQERIAQDGQAPPPQAGGSFDEAVDVVCAVEYTVVEGDWLSKLAGHFFGDIFQYPTIVQATNQKNFVDDSFAQIVDPDVIEPGWKLCIVDAAGDDVARSEVSVVKMDEEQMAAAVAEKRESAAEMEAPAEAPAAEESHEATPWSYEGESGPDAWGTLDPAYERCATGQTQSPVDIAAIVMSDLADITFNYQPSALDILNTGHTIQVDYEAGSWIELDGQTYELRQLHFHTPSEHTIGGKPFEMEMHLVHKNADDEIAIVGVMIREGLENGAIAPVWENMPTESGGTMMPAGVFNVADLLPEKQTSYRYNGSLTTPPCTEGVKWIVLTTPIELSAAQIAAFEDIFEFNNRPVQPLNERTILLDSGRD